MDRADLPVGLSLALAPQGREHLAGKSYLLTRTSRLMAALWMSRCGIKTRLIDRRQEHVRVGQADGIQSRSLEIFDSFDIVDKIWKESCHMVEVSCFS